MTDEALKKTIMTLRGHGSEPAEPAPTDQPRQVKVLDGRIGWPEVVVYLITAGPRAGSEIPVPPSILHDPDLLDPAYERVTGNRGTYPFVRLVKDPVAYERLRASGWLDSPEHRGERPEPVDNRRTS